MLALGIWSPIRKAMHDAVGGSTVRNNWDQPNMTSSQKTAEGWPLYFDQCPIEVISAG